MATILPPLLWSCYKVTVAKTLLQQMYHLSQRKRCMNEQLQSFMRTDTESLFLVVDRSEFEFDSFFIHCVWLQAESRFQSAHKRREKCTKKKAFLRESTPVTSVSLMHPLRSIDKQVNKLSCHLCVHLVRHHTFLAHRYIGYYQNNYTVLIKKPLWCCCLIAGVCLCRWRAAVSLEIPVSGSFWAESILKSRSFEVEPDTETSALRDDGRSMILNPAMIWSQSGSVLRKSRAEQSAGFVSSWSAEAALESRR